MYQVGELIIYGGSGVCRVESVAPGAKDGRMYYTLSPLRQSCTITTPVDNPKVFTRPLISKEEALDLLETAGEIKAVPFCARVPRELTEHYEALFKTYDCKVLLELLLSITLKEKMLREQKKRLGSVDENYLRRTEDFLFGELSVVLEMPPEEVRQMIQERTHCCEV